MERFKCSVLLTFLMLLHLNESDMCDISQTYFSSSPESCNVTFYFKIDDRCDIDNQLFSVTVIEKTESDSRRLLCFITYFGGKCDQQSGCTCGATPQRFSVTRHVQGLQQFEWEITVQLKNGTFIPKSMNLHINCERSDPTYGVTGETTEASNENSVNEASKTVGVSVALLIVTIILVVVCCRKAIYRGTGKTSSHGAEDDEFDGYLLRNEHNLCAPRSGRRSPADAVTFRQVPIEERDGVNSDESHHAYIEVIDDSGEPGTGKTSSHGAEDGESDGYLHPYTSPTPGTYGHSYSSLATRRAKPDDYLNLIPSTSESTAAARTPDSESPYEIV